MPTSFFQVATHIIFGTKGRKPILNDTIHAYIAGIINKLNGITVIVNGTADHIHILCYLPKDMAPVDFIRDIKANSSKWFKDQHAEMQWQAGYAAFGVSKTNMNVIEAYIYNQKQHHAGFSFADEMRKYLGEIGRIDIWEEWFQE